MISTRIFYESYSFIGFHCRISSFKASVYLSLFYSVVDGLFYFRCLRLAFIKGCLLFEIPFVSSGRLSLTVQSDSIICVNLP